MTGQLRNVNCYVTKHSTGTTTRCYADQTLSRIREGVATPDYLPHSNCCGNVLLQFYKLLFKLIVKLLKIDTIII